MKWYADIGPRRTVQITADLAVLVVTLTLVRLAFHLRAQILGFEAAAERVEASGHSVSSGASSAGEVLSDLPLVGGALASAFGVVAEAGGELGMAGTEAGASIASLALLLPLLLVAVPVGYLLLRHLPRRVRWSREVAEVLRLPPGPDTDRLLAHRAVARRALRDLRRHRLDPVAALAAGDWGALARAERRSLGLRDPATPPPTATTAPAAPPPADPSG